MSRLDTAAREAVARRARQALDAMPEITRFYLATLLDTTGCVTINRQRGRVREYNYVRTVYITAIHEELIRWVAQVLACGSVRRVGPVGRSAVTTWRWQAEGRLAHAVVSHLRPYMVLRAATADLLLDMPTMPGNGPAGDAVYAQQGLAHALITAINTREVAAAPAPLDRAPYRHPAVMGVMPARPRPAARPALPEGGEPDGEPADGSAAAAGDDGQPPQLGLLLGTQLDVGQHAGADQHVQH